MSSLQTHMAQSKGYFVVTLAAGLASGDMTKLDANGNPVASTTTTAAVGTVLKDMGKTIFYNNQMYRKVQLVNTAIDASDMAYNTVYIKLPSNTVGGPLSKVAYVPGLPALF